MLFFCCLLVCGLLFSLLLTVTSVKLLNEEEPGGWDLLFPLIPFLFGLGLRV